MMKQQHTKRTITALVMALSFALLSVNAAASFSFKSGTDSSSAGSAATSGEKQKTEMEQWADEIFELTNQERVKAGVKPLERREDLEEMAVIRAKEQATKFSHYRPNGDYFMEMYKDYGIKYAWTGENAAQVAKRSHDAKHTVNVWMNSSGHKANLLNKRFDGIGIGCYEEDGKIYVIQMFIESPAAK